MFLRERRAQNQAKTVSPVRFLDFTRYWRIADPAYRKLVATDNPFEEIIKPIWLIRSWVYPEYGTLDIPNVPPRVLLVMGNWLSQRCIATRVDIRYEKPWGRVTLNQAGQRIQGSGQNTVPGGRGGDPNLDSMMPYKAEVQLVLQEVTENTTYTPWDTTWVRRGWDRGSGFF
jgi:hypothetical protein